MNSRQPKIFGIGLSKTGTTSLARALEILGFKTRDYLGVTRYSAGDLSSIDLAEIDKNDACTDTPVPSFYRELDIHYPGSKFILTVRDMDGWLKSCKKQFTQNLANKQNVASNQLFMDLYGCTVFDEEKFRRGYTNFTTGVYQYFKSRPQDLLIMDITAGDNWEELCTFLGTPIPEVPFPRANVTQIRWLDINEIIAVARKAGNEIVRAHELTHGFHAGREKPVTKSHGAAKSVFEKARHVLQGGSDGIQQKAIKKVERIINKRLKELNHKIPVISRRNKIPPYSERRNWNHFWLIDPLDSNEGILSPEGDFTLSIALIEDRKPVLGIVHAPATNTSYYAMVGKAAFKIEAGGNPEMIEVHTARNRHTDRQGEGNKKSCEIQPNRIPQPASIALSMCMAAEGTLDAAIYVSQHHGMANSRSSCSHQVTGYVVNKP